MNATALLPWIAVAGLVGSLVFSTLSYALRNLSRVKLEERLLARGRSDVLEQIIRTRHDLSLSASAFRLVCNAVVIISVAYYFHADYTQHPILTYVLAVALTVPALLVVSVAVPQAWARYAGEGMIMKSWWLLRIGHAVLYPVVVLMNLCDEIVKRLAGVSLADDPDTEAEQVQQEIMAAVSEGEAEGAVDKEQKKMIEGVISFRDLQVGQIMTPRTDVIAVNVTSAILDVRDKILKEGLSRLPIYEGTLDNIVGVLYAKDLLKFLDTRTAAGPSEAPTPRIDLRTLMRPPLFVPATKPLRDLLREMKLQQVHLAIVLDEYGGTAGLVTTEDIVEEIVGDIADEYERPAPAELRRIDPRIAEVDARMSIPDLNRELELEFPTDQEYNTVGGFVIATLGSIPAKGETVTFNDVTLTVIDSEPRRVKKLRVELPEKNADQPKPAEISPAT